MQKRQSRKKKKIVHNTIVHNTIGGHVGEEVALDSFKKVPKFVQRQKHEAYQMMMAALVTARLSNFSAFCREAGIKRDTLYDWLSRDETVKAVSDYIDAQTQADRVEIRDTIKRNINENAAYARLYSEKYEKWQPSAPAAANIQINFNFLNPPKQPPKDAEFEVEDT